jgi:hypothetical protein
VYLDENGGWMIHTNVERETSWIFVPYGLAADIWADWTGGANPDRRELRKWMAEKRLVFAALASSTRSGESASRSRFASDPRFVWVPVAKGSAVHLDALADIEILETPEHLLDPNDVPKRPRLLH